MQAASFSEAIPNVEATAEVTAASVDNLKFLRDGQSDIALTLADTLENAVKGQASFKEFGRVPALALAAPSWRPRASARSSRLR